MYKILFPAAAALLLSGCSFFQRVRGLPPQNPEPQTIQRPESSPPPGDDSAAQPLKIDPGFDGINTGDSQAEHDALLQRRKQDIFSLKGEDKPIRSIKGANPVESEELNKVYDDLDNGRKSGSGVFKFY